MPVCDRVRVGGTISGSTLSGGTLIESQAFALLDGHSALLGHPGFQGSDPTRLGIDGEDYQADKAYRPRFMTLSVAAFDRSFNGTITAADRCDQLDINVDTLMGLIDGRFIVERDTEAGTRWIKCQVAAGVVAIPGPVFGGTHSAYTFAIPVKAAYPLWQSETLHQTVISGAGTITNAGNARIPNAEFVFAGDGTFTNSDGDENGDSYGMTVAGSSGAVTVNVEAGTVTEGGSAADNLFTADKPYWMRLGVPGDVASVSVTSTVSTTVNYRDQWF